MKKYNKVVHLSVQQLTDCSSDSEYGNNGCKGGNVWNAYRYIYENGIIEDSAYQFSSGKTGIQVKLYFNTLKNKIVFEKLIKKGKCRFKNGLLDGKPYNGAIYKISSFIWVKQDDDLALKEVLDQYGPVAVTIDASHDKFVSYNDGGFGLCNSNINLGSKKLK